MRLVWLALLVLPLAGCAEDSGPAQADILGAKDVAPPKTGLGSISGVAVDQTIVPAANVVIKILGQDVNTTTNDEGQFVFEDVKPGVYFLEASGPGYNATQVGVEVKADQVSKPRIVLPVVPIKEPYHVTIERKTFNLMSVPVVIVYYGGEYIELDGKFDTVVVDGAWSGDVFVVLEEDAAINTAISSSPGGWGTSFNTPVKFSRHLDGENLPDDIEGLNWNSKPGFDTISFQAQGQMFFTMWYNSLAPEGWSVLNGDS